MINQVEFEAKLMDVAVPNNEVEFTVEEASALGAFVEDALTKKEAQEGAIEIRV